MKVGTNVAIIFRFIWYKDNGKEGGEKKLNKEEENLLVSTDTENQSPGENTSTPTQRLIFDGVDLVRPVTPDGNVTVSVMSPRREQIQFERRSTKEPLERVAFVGQSIQPLETYSSDIQKLNGNVGKHPRDER